MNSLEPRKFPCRQGISLHAGKNFVKKTKKTVFLHFLFLHALIFDKNISKKIFKYQATNCSNLSILWLCLVSQIEDWKFSISLPGGEFPVIWNWEFPCGEGNLPTSGSTLTVQSQISILYHLIQWSFRSVCRRQIYIFYIRGGRVIILFYGICELLLDYFS